VIGPDPLNAPRDPPITGLVDLVLSPFARLLPFAEEVGPRRRRAAAAATAVLLLSLAVHLAYTGLGLGVGSQLVDTIVNRWGRQVVMGAAVALCALRVRREDPDRATWLALTVALGCWTLGNTYWNVVLYTVESPASPPPPTPAGCSSTPSPVCASACTPAGPRTAYRPARGSTGSSACSPCPPSASSC
jgi:MFS family permease